MNKTKYLISFDLDETLLNEKHQLSLLTKLGLKRLKRNGHHLLINSGRCLKGILPLIKELDLFDEFVSCNDGTSLYKINRNFQISKKIAFKFDTQLINDFFNEIKGILDYAGFSVDEKVYLYKQENIPVSIFAFMKYDTQKINISSFNFQDEEITVSSFGINPSGLEKFEQIIKKEKYSSFHFTSWGLRFNHLNYDLALNNINKGSGVINIAKELNINLDNVICYGDTLNDISMLTINNQGYLLKGNEKLAKAYNISTTEHTYKKNGVIRHLYKHYRFLF